MDKEFLSKHKYIYQIDMHQCTIQRFPVIYINKEFTYYKFPGGTTLNCVRTNDVCDNLTESVLDTVYGRIYELYSWNISDNARQLLNTLRVDDRRRKLMQEIASSKARCATLSRQLEEEKQRYANLESAIKTEFDNET